MKKIFARLFWLALALLGVRALVMLAVPRGGPVNSVHLIIAALCV